jgi:hypothetical protein
MASEGRRGSRADARERGRRRARRVGAAGFLLAASWPAVVWHDLIASIAREWRPDAVYLVSQWTPWALIALGLLFALPVAWSIGRDPESRWYPRARNAYAAWAVSLYVLGVLLGVQVATIASLSGAG